MRITMTQESLYEVVNKVAEFSNLYELLKDKYPPHHYKHIEVWSSFWNMVGNYND